MTNAIFEGIPKYDALSLPKLVVTTTSNQYRLRRLLCTLSRPLKTFDQGAW